LNRGIEYASYGYIEAAQKAYQQASDDGFEISAKFWKTLCLWGCIHHRAPDVLFAGNKAVELAPNSISCRSILGLAKTLIGNFPDAIEDFNIVLERLSGKFPQAFEESLYTYIDIDALQAEENPFTPEVLEKIRKEMQTSGIPKMEFLPFFIDF
jgi:tetratricopeptide (TPR) repeat protein